MPDPNIDQIHLDLDRTVVDDDSLACDLNNVHHKMLRVLQSY